MIVKIPMALARELDPNFKGHWGARKDAAKNLRGAAFICALDWRHGNPMKYDKAEVSITIVIRDGRSIRDTDNALASLKPAIDGCVDAGVIQDDDDKHLLYRMPILWRKDKENAPMIILEFKEVK